MTVEARPPQHKNLENVHEKVKGRGGRLGGVDSLQVTCTDKEALRHEVVAKDGFAL